MVIVKTKDGRPVFSKYIKGKMRISYLFFLEQFINTGQKNKTLYNEPARIHGRLKNEEDSI